MALDTSLRMTDAGRSAYNRDDFDSYALGEFAAHLKAGRVKKGSYLLLENLDRLSRENVGVAVERFLSLVNGGAVVVQLLPKPTEFRRPVDMMQVMQATLELSRGHSESAMKAERQAKFQAAKREAVRGSGAVALCKPRHDRPAGPTDRLPGWVRYDVDAGRLVLIPERAATVRRVYELARGGLGAAAVAGRLNADGVPVIGRTHLAVRGQRETPPAERERRAVRWTESTVYHLLRTRAAIGEYQPHVGRGRAGRRPDGDPVPEYFPQAVPPPLFWEVQQILAGRRTARHGRRGKHTNLLAGLLHDARTGGSLTYKHGLKGRPAVLIPTLAKQAGAVWTSFPAGPLEAALLDSLREVDPTDVWPPADPGPDAAAVAADLAATDALIAKWKARMDDPELVDVVADKLKGLGVRRKELSAAVDAGRREAGAPAADSLAGVRTLADALAADPSDDARERLRAALRRAVSAVRCLFAPGRGSEDRLALVQVEFRGTSSRRLVQVFYRPPRGGGGGATRPGLYAALTVKHPDDRLPFDDYDLRHEHLTINSDRVGPQGQQDATAGWREMVQFLKSYPADLLDRLLKDGQPVPAA